MTKCQCEADGLQTDLRAQTAITELHSTHQDMVFDLGASFSCTDDVFPREAVQSSVFFL